VRVADEEGADPVREAEVNHSPSGPVPQDEGTRPGMLRQVKWQDQRWAALAHRQHHAPLLSMNGLGRPVDRVERFDAPGILHAHLRVFFAQFACGLDVREESVHHHLYRLAMQAVPPFGHPLQLLLLSAGQVYCDF